MKYGTLARRHPCCDLGVFRRYDALYRGGLAFRKIVGEFLPRNPVEDGAAYEARKAEASYRSYAGPITDAFAAQLFASPFLVRATKDGETVAADDFYGAFREDADGAGTDLVSFLKARFITSLVKGAAWWVAEMPDEGDAPAVSRLDWEERGLGLARLCALEPDAVLDWECDDLGNLLWAITHTREMRRDDPRQERQLVTETFKLYDAANVETFRIVYDPKKRGAPRAEDDVPSVGVKPHGFPRVPLVEMRLPDGLWLLNRVAEAQIEHFRFSAALGWAARRRCFPIPVAHLAGSGTEPEFGKSGFLKMGLEEKLEWASPDTAPIECIQKEIETQKDEIYRVGSQMAASVNNSAAAMGRSGDSKAADMAATEICLASYAVHVREAIEETYELISDARGDTDITFSIEGMNSFNLDTVTVTLQNIQTAKNLGIPSPTLKKELAMKAADLLLPDASQEIKDTIREEIETSEDRMPDTAPPLPGQDPNAEGPEEQPSGNEDGQSSDTQPTA